MDPRLQSAIATPKIQGHAGDLVRLALQALEDLKQLDEGLYERFVASRKAPNDPSAAAAGLRKLWAQTFKGLLELLELCRSLEGDPKQREPDTEVNFDFGDLEDGALEEGGATGLGAVTLGDGELDLGSSDIGDLLSGIDEHHDEGDAEKWTKVLEKVGSIEYGLRSQHTEACARLEVALEAGEINQVLGLLDDTQSSSSEGVHALVAAVYEAFVPDVNPASVVPGYLTSLGRALLVRRGLAELAMTVTPYNNRLQDDNTRLHQHALTTIREVMQQFVSSVVCRAMRPADRWQMVEFESELQNQSVAAARLTSEGLAKYLESLGSINQREVLLLHDQRTLEEMRESLATARGLVDISPRTANEMLERAYQAAQRLRGRNPATDRLVIQLEKHAPTSSNPTETTAFLERLEAVLSASER
ncbi:MAG: hypothetical protein H0T42_00885 [Deltaproteobacteria bacterium]|nr:hypothetical protein [Deltaproteobacteria bacterium]